MSWCLSCVCAVDGLLLFFILFGLVRSPTKLSRRHIYQICAVAETVTKVTEMPCRISQKTLPLLTKSKKRSQINGKTAFMPLLQITVATTGASTKRDQTSMKLSHVKVALLLVAAFMVGVYWTELQPQMQVILSEQGSTYLNKTMASTTELLANVGNTISSYSNSNSNKNDRHNNMSDGQTEENPASAVVSQPAAVASTAVDTTATTTFTNTIQENANSGTPKLHQDKIFIVAAGGRTTPGTELLFQATCHLGFPSHRRNLGCIPAAVAAAASTSAGTNNDIPQQYVAVETLHNKVSQHVRNLLVCLHRKLASCGLNAKRWKTELVQRLQDLVQNGEFVALHHNPYTLLLAQIIPMAKIYYKETIILFNNDDDGLPFAQSTDFSQVRPICLDYGTSEMDKQTLAGGAFDMIGCIDRALSRVSAQEAESMDLSNIFTTMDIVSQVSETAVNSVNTEMIQYQDAVSGIADFILNTYTTGGTTSKMTLADELANTVPAIAAHRQPPAQMVNWWHKIQVDTR